MSVHSVKIVSALCIFGEVYFVSLKGCSKTGENGTQAKTKLPRDEYTILTRKAERAYADGDCYKAGPLFQAAYITAESAALSDPHNHAFQIRLAESCLKMATVSLCWKEAGPYLERLNQALGILEKLRAIDPEDLRILKALADCRNQFVSNANFYGPPEDLFLNLRSFVEISEKLAEAEPNDKKWKVGLADARQLLGDGGKYTGDLASAQKHCREALEIYENLEADRVSSPSPPPGVGHHIYNASIWGLLLTNGEIANARGKNAEAEKYYQESLDVAEVEGREDDRIRMQNKSISTLGEFHRKSCNPALALTYFEKLEKSLSGEQLERVHKIITELRSETLR